MKTASISDLKANLSRYIREVSRGGEVQVLYRGTPVARMMPPAATGDGLRQTLIEPGQEGGCQCGAIRYRLLRAPVALYACHCKDCQKQSSSAFGLSMWVERDAIEFSGPEPCIFLTRGDSGREKLCAFCENCGTRIYHAGGVTRSAGSDTLSIKAGTLDDTSRITPTCHLWTKSAQPWLTPLLENSLCFETEPDSEEMLGLRV